MTKTNRRLLGSLSVFLTIAVLIAGTATAVRAETQVPASNAQIRLSFAPLVKRAAPAVVNIYARKTVRRRQVSPLFGDPFFRRFFGEGFGLGMPRERVERSLGSGVIVDADGIIVTNEHVIGGAEEITVVLADRREFEAEIVGTDERTDLAVLRVDTEGERFPILELRDSDTLEVGDLVLAIGNPFGVGQTVTSGIVSAQARTHVGKSDLSFFIQTDAAINPGNSGGALVTMDGKLVGINSAIFSKSGGSHGIGFAIPSNMVRAVIAGVRGGRLVRPWFGASGQVVTSELAAGLGLDRPGGVLINNIYKRGPADRARLRMGDVVLAIGGKEVTDPEALKFRIATFPVGGSTDLTIWRKGRKRKLTIDLVEPPEDPPRKITELSGPHPLSGATVANMSPAVAVEVGLDVFEPGVIIFAIRRGSLAARVGFRAGDRILAVNGVEADRVRRLKKLVARRTERWRIAFERGGKKHEVTIEL